MSTLSFSTPVRDNLVFTSHRNLILLSYANECPHYHHYYSKGRAYDIEVIHICIPHSSFRHGFHNVNNLWQVGRLCTSSFEQRFTSLPSFFFSLPSQHHVTELQGRGVSLYRLSLSSQTLTVWFFDDMPWPGIQQSAAKSHDAHQLTGVCCMQLFSELAWSHTACIINLGF